MSNYLPSSLGIAVVLFASTALAVERSELEKSSIKAASDCVAAEALKNPNISRLYREDRLDEVTDGIVLHSGVCDNPLRAMRLLHDRIYGAGTGRRFLRGDYLADLPRAVHDRIRVEVAKRGLDSPDVRETYAMPPGSKDLKVIKSRPSPSTFHPAKPDPLEKYTALECVPVQATDTEDRDRIYKIVVNISFNDNWQPEDMSVLHYAASGTAYNRADQYTRSDLTQIPGRIDYSWTGTWIKNSAVTMRGHLKRSTANKWTYPNNNSSMVARITACLVFATRSNLNK